MSIKNKVIVGDYKGSGIVSGRGKTVIANGFFKQVKLDETTIEKFEVYDSTKVAKATSAIGRGAVGSFFLGPIGLLAAASAKKKGVYSIFVQFKDGKRSLLEVDEKVYRQFMLLKIGNNEIVEENTGVENNIDIPDQIKKLSELKESGIITEEEFNNKKTELLSKL